MNKVLLIDDDPELFELLAGYLESEGFVLDSAYDGESGLKLAEDKEYSLIILDIMLPDTSGFNILSKLRAAFDVPVIMLTGRGEEIDRVVGLEMGADDYMAKPFPLRELLARMRAVLRRYSPVSGAGGPSLAASPQKDIEIGGVVINRSARHVTLDESVVHMTSTEFGLIEQLALNIGSIVNREELMEKALGRGVDFDDYILNVHMSNLRKKIGKHLSIKTIRGRGYLLVHPQKEAV